MKLDLYGQHVKELAVGETISVSVNGENATEIYLSTIPGNQPERFRLIETLSNENKTYGPYTYIAKVKVVANGNDVDIDTVVSAIGGGSGISAANRAIRFATFGDSTANTPPAMSPASHFCEILTAPFPASGTTNLGSDSEKRWVSNYYPAAHQVFVGGIAGETTAQMLARDSATSSTTRKAITDLLGAYPDVVFLRGGSINDVTPLTTASADSLITDIFDRHVKIINRLLSGGVIVIDEGIYGYDPGDSSANTLFRLAAIVRLNSLFKQFAENSGGKVFFIDTLGVTSDSTGRFLPGVMKADGNFVHLSGYGGKLVGKLEADMLTSLFGASPLQRYKGVNLIGGQSMMDTETTVGHGKVASGFTIGSAGTVTRQNAKVEIIDGKVFQTSEYVINSTNAGGNIYMPFGTVLNAAADNDIYGVEVEVLIQPSSIGALNVRGAGFTGSLIVNGPAGNVAYNIWSGDQPKFTESEIIKLVIPPVRVQLPSGNVTGGNFFVEIKTDDFTNYGSHTIKLGVSNPRIVKIGNSLLNV